VEIHLQENIAELFAHTDAIAFTECVDEFVRLFEQVLYERLVCLFCIPWATHGRAKSIHDFG
jgi:hypothetical protein